MTIVHCMHKDYTHYIGRGKLSIGLQNHYSHKPSMVPGTIMVPDVETAIRRFEEDTRANPALMAQIKALPGDAVLGCWCVQPGPCHGHVIIKLWKEANGK